MGKRPSDADTSQRKRASTGSVQDLDGPSEGEANIDQAECDRIAGEIGRFLLFRDHTKSGITRADLKKAILGDRKDPGGRIMKAALERANEKLGSVFGLNIWSLQHAEPSENEEELDPDVEYSYNNSQGKLVLGNVLTRGQGTEHLPAAQAAYLGLVASTVGILRRSTDQTLDEAKLLEWLAKVGVTDGCKHFPHPIEAVKRMQKELYLHAKGGTGPAAQTKLYTEGPRFRAEFPDKAWKGFVDRVCARVGGSGSQTQTQGQ